MRDLAADTLGYVMAAIVMAWALFWIFMFTAFLIYAVAVPIVEAVLL